MCWTFDILKDGYQSGSRRVAEYCALGAIPGWTESDTLLFILFRCSGFNTSGTSDKLQQNNKEIKIKKKQLLFISLHLTSPEPLQGDTHMNSFQLAKKNIVAFVF